MSKVKEYADNERCQRKLIYAIQAVNNFISFLTKFAQDSRSTFTVGIASCFLSTKQMVPLTLP